MRIAIVGLGAVGGLLAARLAAAGESVSALARGATLRAVERGGIRLIEPGATDADAAPPVPLRASADPAALGEQDLVVVALKSNALPAVAPTLAPLIGERTVIVPAMNGVPWWFFHGLDPAFAQRRWTAIDADGAVGQALPAQRVVGCVVHLACSTPEPGVVRRNSGNRLIFGEPDGATSDRLGQIAALFARAGFDVETSARIQHDVWFKLWGNMTVNPISAITGATTDRIMDDPLVREFVSATMREAAAVGSRIGLPIDTAPEERHKITRQLGAFRSSMLQDVDADRPVELDALVASVAEIARAVGVATPNIDALLGLARLHARVHGLYPPPPLGSGAP
ncbi:MAG: 2-dehydropantoate 2-reductase [Burkholderiaceae bacterium]|nr:2-dehydropantoate 2-reductase [Burkholderiaceae bacterium]